MNKFFLKTPIALAALFALAIFSACGKQAAPTQGDAAVETVAAEPVATVQSEVPEASRDTAEGSAEADPPPGEAIDAQAASAVETTPPAPQRTASVQPSVRLAARAPGPPVSARFKEGTNYQKLVPAQPTSVEPGQIEVIEVFWYGCGHCFALDPGIESWRDKGKASYVQFLRVPAMWNDMTRLHARLFYTAETLGKLDEMHTQIFREIHVRANPLNSAEQIGELFQRHGVGAEEFKKTFSSFTVESNMQRADLLNRRYRVQSVPMFVVNGKYTTDVSGAGNEQQLFHLLDELAAHEHGG
jgi:thiol:disulfide interchange protein DsbA